MCCDAPVAVLARLKATKPDLAFEALTSSSKLS